MEHVVIRLSTPFCLVNFLNNALWALMLLYESQRIYRGSSRAAYNFTKHAFWIVCKRSCSRYSRSTLGAEYWVQKNVLVKFGRYCTFIGSWGDRKHLAIQYIWGLVDDFVVIFQAIEHLVGVLEKSFSMHGQVEYKSPIDIRTARNMLRTSFNTLHA